jgi:predicted Rossmann fold flavoprotein
LKISIIGAGAAGYFAAINSAEAYPNAQITIYERGKEVLQKVRISGGGRCNVTHNCLDAKDLVKFYPRGSRELLAPFLRFGPTDTIAWFEKRGVPLKIESDGRMFPQSNVSASIIDCLTKAANAANIRLEIGCRLEKISQNAQKEGWILKFGDQQEAVETDYLIMTSGSSTAIWEMLADLGHKIIAPVPSLFTFNTKDTRLRDLAGVSVPNAHVQIKGTKLESRGPLLITHWGMSGPGILRLSAWGARDLADLDYHFTLTVNWLGTISKDEMLKIIQDMRQNFGKNSVFPKAPETIRTIIPTRLWQSFVAAAKIKEDTRWADLDKVSIQNLAIQLTEAPFSIAGKSTFKEEFVTAGGVDLKEINFKTFESKLFPRLYFAGEVLNIDAITGGFNFQAAWTGGWIAGLLDS